jgi:hypothetical protein
LKLHGLIGCNLFLVVALKLNSQDRRSATRCGEARPLVPRFLSSQFCGSNVSILSLPGKEIPRRLTRVRIGLASPTTA